MAVHIHTGQVTYNYENQCIQQCAFINQYDNRITALNGQTLQFLDKFKIVHVLNGFSDNVSIYDMEGNKIAGYGRDRNYDTQTWNVSLISTEKFICFTESTTHRYIWIIDGNDIYFTFLCVATGAYGNGGIDLDCDSSAGYFTKIGDTSVKNFRVPKNFPYSIVSPKIMFANTSVMINTSGETKIIDYFRSCSTVALGSNITVGGKNYYAVGTNTLIEVEE